MAGAHRQSGHLCVSFAFGINHGAGSLTSRPYLGNYDAPLRLPFADRRRIASHGTSPRCLNFSAFRINLRGEGIRNCNQEGMGSPDSLSSQSPLSLTCPRSNIADGGRWPPKCPSPPPPPPVVYDDDGDGGGGGNGGGRRSRSRSRACITSCSLGSASSRLSIDRLCPRGPHGDSAFVQTRASPPVLVSNMAPVGGHVASPPPQRCCTTTDATRTVSAHSTTARDIWCSHESVSLSVSLFLSQRLSFPPALSLSLPAFSSSETA